MHDLRQPHHDHYVYLHRRESDGSGRKWSEETRVRLSQARKGRVHSPETRAKMSATQKGRPKSKPPHNKGVKMPEEQRLKLVGRPKSQECIEKLRAKAIARWASIRADERQSADNSGMNNPRADKIEYLFVHSDGRWLRATRVGFAESTGIRPNKLFGSNQSITLHGWRRYCS